MNGTESSGANGATNSASRNFHHPVYASGATSTSAEASSSGHSMYNVPILPDNPTSLDPAHLSLNLQIQDFIESVRTASLRGPRASANASSSRWGTSAQQQQAMSSSIHSLASTSSCASASTALSRPTSPAPSSVSSSASGSMSHQPFAAAAAAAAGADLPGSSPLASPIHSSANQNGNHARTGSGSAAANGASSSSGGPGNAATVGSSTTSQLHRKATGKSAVRHHAHFQNPTSASSSKQSHTSSSNNSVSASLFTAIAHAQSLYRAVDALPSYWQALYRKELEKVTSLLAYPELEGSPVKQLLHPNRRDALAEQINSAILFRTGRPSQPLIETAARQTTFVWKQLATDQIAVPAGHPLLAQIKPAGSGSTSTQTGSATAALYGLSSSSSSSGGGGGAAASSLASAANTTAGLNASLAALVHATHSTSGSYASAGSGSGGGSKSDSRRGGGSSKETGKVLQPWNLEVFLNSR
ncbi:hypothetical protein V8E36_006438 [Tilletia maclaganii]